jgi:FkbM family methyltransferase
MTRLAQLVHRTATASLIGALGWLNRLSNATYKVGPDGAAALFEGCWFRYSVRNFGCTGNIDYAGEAENATRGFLFDQLNSGQVFFDIGAHGGVFTLTSLNRAPGVIVHSFEPQPEELIGNLALNEVSSDRVHAVALGNTTGVVKMTTQERSSNHISENGDRTVPMVRLDEYVAKFGIPDPDWIKIDIEGMELPALRGAEQILRRSHPTIICEINHISGRYGTRVTDLTGYLESLGYSIHALRHGKLEGIGTNPLPLSDDFNYWFMARPEASRSIPSTHTS